MSTLRSYIENATKRKLRSISEEKNYGIKPINPSTSIVDPRNSYSLKTIQDFITADKPTTKHVNIGIAFCCMISSICPVTFYEKSWDSVVSYLKEITELPRLSKIEIKAYQKIKKHYLAGSDIKEGLISSALLILLEMLNSEKLIGHPTPSPIPVVETSQLWQSMKACNTNRHFTERAHVTQIEEEKNSIHNYAFKYNTSIKDSPTKRLIKYKKQPHTDIKKRNKIDNMMRQLNEIFPIK